MPLRMVLSTFAELRTHHHNPILEHLHHPQWKPMLVSSHSPPLPVQPVATTNLLSASLRFLSLDISYK